MLRGMPFRVLLFTLIYTSSVYAASEAPEALPVIDRVEGDQTVVVRTPKGNRVAARGTKVNIGDFIRTGPRASVKVVFPDGSKLLIGRSSEVEVKPPIAGTAVTELHEGEIRGVIKKPKGLQNISDAAKNNPPKFMVRSRAAVMGVRGTDFVYSVEEVASKTVGEGAKTVAKSSLHTLEGMVEVAPDEDTLFMGKGVKVPHNQAVEAHQGIVGKPHAFDRGEFVSRLESAQPEFASFSKADPDLQTSYVEAPDLSLPEPPAPPKERFKLLSFQLQGLYLTQGRGSGLGTAEFSWNPWLRLFWRFGLRAHAGIFPVVGYQNYGPILANRVAVQLTLDLIGPLAIEVGIGRERWGDALPSGELTLMTLVYRFDEKGFLQRIFIGHSNFRTVTTDAVHCGNPSKQEMCTATHPTGVDQFAAGVGFQF